MLSIIDFLWFFQLFEVFLFQLFIYFKKKNFRISKIPFFHLLPFSNNSIPLRVTFFAFFIAEMNSVINFTLKNIYTINYLEHLKIDYFDSKMCFVSWMLSYINYLQMHNPEASIWKTMRGYTNLLSSIKEILRSDYKRGKGVLTHLTFNKIL